MILELKLDQYMVKMYLHNQNEVPRSQYFKRCSLNIQTDAVDNILAPRINGIWLSNRVLCVQLPEHIILW